MAKSRDEISCKVKITNPLGFHVRPIQRFAELAQIFKGEITVEIDGNEASGRSVMGLMSLGGRYGADMLLKARGEDARQALDVMRYLVNENFFVEDLIEPGERPQRHKQRLKALASCFNSDIKLVLDGEEVDISGGELDNVNFCPDDNIDFIINGEDQEQARQVMDKLVQYRFYMESEINSNQD